MTETIDQLAAYLERRNGRPAKIAIWAHNSHLGDARATEMGERGEVNIGQLVRERYGDEALLVGFTTHAGTVAAAREWESPVEIRRVRPSLPGSVERLFHETGVPRFLLVLGDDEMRRAFAEPLLERAIGVIYVPETERHSHYFEARLAKQFDAMIHFDETQAVEPLDRTQPKNEEVPESYPTGL
jgi:erythromycin esterase-like protein